MTLFLRIELKFEIQIVQPSSNSELLS